MHTSDDEWVFSSPTWWLSAIAECCATEGAEFVQLPSGDNLAGLLRDGQAAAMQYLACHNLSTEDAARCLFWAKALKKWRLTGLPGVDPTQRARLAFAGYHDRNAAAETMELPRYLDGMRRVLSLWLPEVAASYETRGRFGPGAVLEHYEHPQRFCLQTTWLDAGMDPYQPWEHFECDVSLRQGTCKLTAVPKDWDKDRLITVEPCYQSYVQQAVRNCLLESIHAGPLRGSAMDLKHVDGQLRQRALALSASKSGQLATLDLKDASDRISWAAVQAVFPSWVVRLLELSRSAFFIDQGVTSPQFIFAGMGNATTFVVETLFFSAYVVAFQKAHGIKPWVSTFGDDVICDSRTAEGLLDDDPSGCFVINRLKSFWGSMNVRESCGVFAYKGFDITVPKIAGYPATFAGRLGLAQLQQTCDSSRFLFLRRLSESIVSRGLLPNWPYRVEGYPSFCSWSVAFSALPESRYNPTYQRREALVPVETPRTVSYPCEDPFVDDELADGVLGLDQEELDKAYALSRNPPAQVWLDATLAGQVSTTASRINAAGDSIRSRVSFPLAGSLTRPRWCRVVPADNPVTRS